VPEPFARDEQRAADVEAERVVLERRSVALAHQEPDQAGVRVVQLVPAPREADARGVHDREVGRHRVVQADETVVEDRNDVVGHDLGGDSHGVEGNRGICRHLGLVLPVVEARLLPA
jgi:hypothetical protein